MENLLIVRGSLKGKYISFEQSVLWLKINNFDSSLRIVSKCIYKLDSDKKSSKKLLREIRLNAKSLRNKWVVWIEVARDGLLWNQVWLENSEQEFNEVLWILKNHSSERAELFENFSSYVKNNEEFWIIERNRVINEQPWILKYHLPSEKLFETFLYVSLPRNDLNNERDWSIKNRWTNE